MRIENNLETNKQYISWLRHSEHFEYGDIFPGNPRPGEESPYLYRGLKKIEFLIGEILQNNGLPMKGPVWLSSDKNYASTFANGFLLEIDPLLLGLKYPGAFIKDKYENYTTGLSVNIYSCLSAKCRREITELFHNSPFWNVFSQQLAFLLNDTNK